MKENLLKNIWSKPYQLPSLVSRENGYIVYFVWLPQFTSITSCPCWLKQVKRKRPCFQVFILSISNILLYSGAGGGGGGISVYSCLFHLDVLSAQQVWQHYSEHISAWLWRNHMFTLLCWQIQRGRESRPFLLDSYHQEAFCSSIKIYIYIYTTHWTISQLHNFNRSRFSYKDGTAMRVAGLKNATLQLYLPSWQGKWIAFMLLSWPLKGL